MAAMAPRIYVASLEIEKTLGSCKEHLFCWVRGISKKQCHNYCLGGMWLLDPLCHVFVSKRLEKLRDMEKHTQKITE